MNGPGDLPLQHYSSTPDANNCSITAIIPNLGMSSCRGRAEAFARRLSSKLRTLGTQADETDNSPEDEPIINGGDTLNSTWVTDQETQQPVTDLQPLRHESDSFFDFDCELESPGSPVDECEYLRLIESTSNTPHNSAPESGYACASAASSHSSSDGPYYDVNSESESTQQQVQKRKMQLSRAQQHPHICQPHLSERDEVDCAKPPSSTIANLCNGHDSPVSTKASSTQTSESQHISNNVTKALLCEGPNIEETHPKSQHPEPIIKQNGRTPTLQDQILLELQKQSQEKTDDELEAEQTNIKNLPAEATIQTEAEPEPSVSESEENICKVLHTLINASAENGEDVLKIEVCELEESQEEQAKESLTSEETKKQQLSVNTELNTELSTELSTEPNTDELQIQELTVNLEQITEQTTKESQVQELTVNTVLSTEPTTEKPTEKPTVKLTENPTEKPTEKPKIQILTVNTQLCTELVIESPKIEELTVNTELSATQDKPVTKIQHVGLHHDTTDDEDDCRPQRVRRCSSLKTGKTPPGTPGRKKIVRFADVLGLDLADIKTFLDEIPTVPKSAYEDLEILESEPPLQLGPKSHKLLMPLFQQPGGLAGFLDTVRAKQVSLENAAVTDTINHTITGSVRVRNLDFHKSVHIRYSLDGWRSFADLKANYAENSCDGFSDKFTFVLFGNSLHVGQRLEFAVRFQCKGQQYWDNNYGSNYCFQCLPTSTVPAPVQVFPSHHTNNMVGLLSPLAGEAWCSSFY